MSFSVSSDVKLQRLWLLKGMCVRYISSLISQKKKLTWNFQLQKAYLKLLTSETYCRLQVWTFMDITKDFYFQCSSSLPICDVKLLAWKCSHSNKCWPCMMLLLLLFIAIHGYVAILIVASHSQCLIPANCRHKLS